MTPASAPSTIGRMRMLARASMVSILFFGCSASHTNGDGAVADAPRDDCPPIGAPRCVDSTCCSEEAPAILQPGCSYVCPSGFVNDAICDPAASCGDFASPCARNADCTLDTSGCAAMTCGNGVAEGDEECDGTDLAGATCATAGFSQGTLGCTAACRFDVVGCCNDFCDTAFESVCVGDSVQLCAIGPDGCLDLQITDCTLEDDVCDENGGSASCICVDRCSVEGNGRCVGAVGETCTLMPDGCLDWVSGTDCSTTGQLCAIGPDGPTCTADATGEDCTDPYPISNGENVIAWTAANADYLTIQPSCNTSTLTGPDLVLAYTATVDGIATIVMDKPASARQVIVGSASACGTMLPEVACAADTTPTFITDTFAVSAGTTYHFYVRDTTSGTATLTNPLILHLGEVSCAGFTNAATSLSPANGSTIATASPILSVELEHPVNQAVGVITITGDLGTNRVYDLSTSPSQVTFSPDGRTITIDPSTALLPGETVTVSWSGIVDAFCAAPVAPPTWSFSMLTPACTPGVGGMVGTSTARLATGIGTVTENYVAADTSPNGYVYVGGASDLYRIPKAGGAVEDVVLLSGIPTTPLGSAMAIVGSRIFTLDTTTTTTTPFLWRLSVSGGTTWNPLGYAQWTGAGPEDIARALWHDNGRFYFVTDEITAGIATEIWSVSANAISLPAGAVLEGTVLGEEDCDGISGDDDYFYLTCANNDRVVRVDRTTFASELITTAINLSLTKNELHAHDFDGDGTADALYIHSDEERVHYVCAPAGAPPFWTDVLAEFGTGVGGAANYGLGFDEVGGVLWAFDDDTAEFVSIQ